MKTKILLIVLIGISFGLVAQVTDTGDKVGIGTTSPISKLQIEDTNAGGEIGITIKNKNATIGTKSVIDFVTTTTSTKYGSLAVEHTSLGAGAMIFSTRGGDFEKMRITSNGSVGIGTTNPSGKLEILKNADLSTSITIPNSGLIIRADNDGNDASLRFGVDNTNLKALIQTQQTSTAAKFDLLINPFGGNLGIGTNNTNGWKLAVNGNIRAKEIKVETGWSDFVFEKNYNLPTLKEVENHIKEKGHLKDIPSAKEVEENGIFLGEMDSKLLQKIEELTLYTIQQQKEIILQKEKVEKLEKENESLKFLAVKFLELQKRLEKIEGINSNEN